MKPKLAAIVAFDEGRVIGCDGKLPWHLPEDLARFRALTLGCPVIMGRKTWDSLPEKFCPLPKRTNIVVTRTPSTLHVPEGVHVCDSPEVAASLASGTSAAFAWVIGGAEIYTVMLPLCDEVHVTRVAGVHRGDAWFPEFETAFKVVSEEVGANCVWVTYERSDILRA